MTLRHAPCVMAMPVATRDRTSVDKARRASGCSSKEKELQVMLVLSRKVGERIHVGDNIVLEIRRIAGNRVTVALDAPRDVRILRGELEGPVREFRDATPHTEDAATPLATPA